MYFLPITLPLASLPSVLRHKEPQLQYVWRQVVWFLLEECGFAFHPRCVVLKGIHKYIYIKKYGWVFMPCFTFVYIKSLYIASEIKKKGGLSKCTKSTVS